MYSKGESFFDILDKQKQVLTGSIDASISGIIITNYQLPDNPVIYCNKAFEELTGYCGSEIMGKNCRFLQGNDRSQGSRFELQRAVTQGQECHVEMINFRKDGTLFWNELYIAPLFDDQGIISHYIGLQNDITEKKLNELALRIRQVRHSKVEQLKTDFMNTASHELKTPLTRAKASLQLLSRLMDNELTDERQHLLLNHASESLNRLSSLMDDMLSASKQQEDRLRGKFTRFKLSAVIDEVIRQFGLAAKQEIEVTGDLQAEVTADKDRIGQVMINIFNNVVKHAPGSLKVEVDISGNEQEVRVAITDFGPGIPADILPYIFDRYYRGGHSSLLQVSGFGLGLFVAKEIIISHEGQLGARKYPRERQYLLVYFAGMKGVVETLVFYFALLTCQKVLIRIWWHKMTMFYCRTGKKIIQVKAG